MSEPPAAAGVAPSTTTYANGGPRPPRGTLNELFFDAVARYDKPDALQVKVDGRYQPISHRTLAERVRRTALGLQALGVLPGDRVAILSENRPEWAIADFGCLTAGVIDVAIYPNIPVEQVEYILRDSGSVAAFASTRAQVEKLVSIGDRLPALRSVISLVAVKPAGADHTLAELEMMGAAVETPERIAQYEREARAVAPDDVATLLYTSGTTGEPKGVMLTHDNLFSNADAAARVLPFAGDDVSLSLLPLSHIFERMAGHYLMQRVGASIAYAESMDSIPVNLAEVRPTFVLCVPRIYEKFYARVLENALSGGWLKKQIFFWARRVGSRWADERIAGRTPGRLLARQYAIADRLVFSKLRERMGGRLRFFVSGGAPLAPEINKFFYAAGLTILEGYGLTETSPVIAVNVPERFRIGTVGPVFEGVEVTIAPDGEILTRGPHVMKGYYNKPDATREAVDAGGWFHTGDIGELRDGFLTITDRKKEIIVTAGGKNIAPQPIENQVKANKYVSQAVMIGDRRKFPVMLVVPNWEQLEKWARGRNIMWTERAQLLAMPTIQAKMEKEVLGELHGLASFETPKRIGLVEQEFTIERGEMTPTLKIKRRVVDTKYKSLIDQLCGETRAAREE